MQIGSALVSTWIAALCCSSSVSGTCEADIYCKFDTTCRFKRCNEYTTSCDCDKNSNCYCDDSDDGRLDFPQGSEKNIKYLRIADTYT